MSDKTGIAWTDATFNPWWGCAKVSPGCDNCYAERDAHRFIPTMELWGAGAGSSRRMFGDKHWNEPLKWNRLAAATNPYNHRRRVFCASMADVFDNHATLFDARARLWELIRATPNLDWQILTKRIGNAKAMLPVDWGRGYPNVWLGASVVNQEEAERDIPKLLATPARTHFLSCEPLLGPIDLMYPAGPFPDGPSYCCSGQECGCMGRPIDPPLLYGVDWVIVGGESGPKARPFDVAWARSIILQCESVSAACFVKQLGAYVVTDGIQGPGRFWKLQTGMHDTGNGNFRKHLTDRAGADPLEWPEDLRVQQFPKSAQNQHTKSATVPRETEPSI